MSMNQVERALIFAVGAHKGQTRKNSTTPYILHPCEAAAIAATITDDPDIIAAVLLHDTIEDTDVTQEDIRREFGDRVASIVAGDTEPDMDDMPREQSWRVRKESSLELLKRSPREVKIMWLSDKLSNMRSFCRMYHIEGNAMWQHFNQKDKKIQAWYYRSVAACLEELGDTDAYREYVSRIDEIFGRERDEQ